MGTIAIGVSAIKAIEPGISGEELGARICASVFGIVLFVLGFFGIGRTRRSRKLYLVVYLGLGLFLGGIGAIGEVQQRREQARIGRMAQLGREREARLESERIKSDQLAAAEAKRKSAEEAKTAAMAAERWGEFVKSIRPGEVLPILDSGLQMCRIESGTYEESVQVRPMGRYGPIENSVMKIHFTTPFFVSASPVTVEAWERLMGRSPEFWPAEGSIAPGEAALFCEELTRRELKRGAIPEGAIFTLPSVDHIKYLLESRGRYVMLDVKDIEREWPADFSYQMWRWRRIPENLSYDQQPGTIGMGVGCSGTIGFRVILHLPSGKVVDR